MTDKTTAKPRRARFIDPDHPFFRRLWARIATVAAACGWGLFELVQGQPFWAIVFLGLGLYAGWVLFVASKAHDPRQDADENQ